MKTKQLMFVLVLLLCGTMTSWADFKDFSVQVNNQDGTLLTSEEIATQGTAFEFGVAVAADGTVSRVAADDASSVATVSGKYHSDHGATGLKVVVPVDGTVKITVGQCTYSSNAIKVTNSAGTEVVTKTPATACWKNDHANITELYYTGEATTLTISGMGYCPYVAVEKSEAVINKYNIAYSLGTETDVTGNVPATVTWTEGDTYAIPANYTLYKEGYTLTGWNDGASTVAIGAEYTPAADVTMTPVFTQNTVSLADRKEPVTLKWNFRRDQGAPTVGWEGKPAQPWVTQATINGETIDVKMDVTTSPGKFNNGNWNDWCQMNNGTTLTIPSCKGAVVSMEAYSAPTTTTIDGQTDYTASGNTISYTVANTAEIIDVVIGDGSYYKYVQTVLPVQQAAGGKTYNNEAASVVFAMNDISNTGAYTATPTDGFSTVAFDSGDCELTGTANVTMTDGTDTGIKGIKFKPSGTTTTLNWFVRPAAGLTFTPTKVSGYVNRCGTDAEKGIVLTAHKTDGSVVDLGTYTAWRQGKSTSTKPYDADAIYKYEITLTPEQQELLAGTEGFYLTSAVGVSSAKEGLFGEVTIAGTVNGTLAEVNKYTIGIAASPVEGGEVSIYPKSDEYIENDEVTLTATPNFGYHFENWTDAAGNEVSTETKFKYTVTANAELTANFKKVNTYELACNVEGGANLYQVQPTPAPTVIDGKNMYEEGVEVTLTATGNEIIAFTNWSDGQTNSEIKVKMTDNVNITANFSAKDYIVGWDFYNAGNNGRVADFCSTADNEAASLILVDNDGNTQGWLDKSTVGAGGYESMAGAAVNWKKLGQYHYQTKINAKDFTNIQVKSQLLCNYNAYSRVVLQYSFDGTEWKDAGEAKLASTKVLYALNATLPAECNHAESLFIRWMPDLASEIVGTSAPDNDGTAISNIFILAEAAIYDDGKAPVLVSKVPAEGADNASANGRVVLTFDKKVQLTAKAKATLGGNETTLTTSGKTVIAQYKGLSYATEYTFKLYAGSVVDLSGNNVLNEDITIVFTTMTKPVVTKALYDFVVPTDGTFTEALAAASARQDKSKRYRIFVMQGDYIIPANSNVMVTGTDGKSYPDPKTSFSSPNVSIIGEDMEKTTIANTMPNDLASNPDAGKGGQANPLEGIRTSGVLYLTGSATNTYFEDITLKTNTPDATGRNVVLVDGGDKTICKDVCLWAYQDTYVSDRTQSTYYFEGGLLRGRTDFLCGSGDVFYNGVTLQMCEEGGYIAVPRDNVKYGYVFKDCTIKGETEKVNGNYYLGRPWTKGAEVYFIDTKMEAVPSAAGWTNMSDDGCTRMAEYNSVSASGTTIDLSSRAKTLGGNPNEPVLTAEEAAEIGDMHNMFGDWDPTIYTEQASAPKNVKYTATTLTWDNDDYALLYAVCKNGKVVDFTIEPTYTIDDATAEWSVRAANEMGGLGEATVAQDATGIEEMENAENDADTKIYNLAGQRLKKAGKGINIIGGKKVIVK